MAELDENLERKTRELSNKDVEKGKEIQSFQEAQNHLLQIQSAQKENLQVERAISGAQAQNDQTMLQAAEIIANSNNGGGPVQGQEVQLNPQTLAILGKYGYGKPGTTTKSNSNQQNIGGKVVINNTTETKTVNKLQQITTPPANVKKISSSDGGTAKFKTWVTSSFARQKEQDAVREKSYQKKEWSLNRSTNKLMKKIEDLGKTIGESLDPKKLVNALGDQMKTLLFLFGTMFLSDNWVNFLETVGKIENWLKRSVEFFGADKDETSGKRTKSRFLKSLIYYLGGDPENDSVGGAFGGFVKSLINLLIEKVKRLGEERAIAVKAVKLPKLESGMGITGLISSFGQYLGDLLTAMISGKAGIESATEHGLQNHSKSDIYSNTTDDGLSTSPWNSGQTRFGSRGNNTSFGDLITVRNAKGNYAGNGGSLERYDIVGNKLRDNKSVAYEASRVVSGMLNDVSTAKVHTTAISNLLDKMNNTAKNEGSILISQDFIDQLKQTFPKIDFGKVNSVMYKFIRRKKTDEERRMEGTNPEAAFGEGYVNRSIAEGVKNVMGADNLVGDIYDSEITDTPVLLQNPTINAGVSYVKSLGKKMLSPDYIYEMRKSSEEGTPEEIELKNGKKKKFFKYYYFTPQNFEKLFSSIGSTLKLENGFKTSGEGHVDSMIALNKYLIEDKKKRLRKESERAKKLKKSDKLYYIRNSEGKYKFTGKTTDSNYLSTITKNIHSDLDNDTLDTYNKSNEELKNLKESWEEEDKANSNGSNQAKNAINRVKEEVTNLVNSGKESIGEALEDLGGKKNASEEDKEKFVKEFRELYKNELKSRGISTDFVDTLVAQSALESRWGVSGLSEKYNNFSGITVPDNLLSRIDHVTINGRNYRVFKDKNDFVKYHVGLLNGNNYKAFEGDPEKDFFNSLKKGGYSSGGDPEKEEEYIGLVKNILNQIKRDYPIESTTKEISSINNTSTKANTTIAIKPEVASIDSYSLISSSVSDISLNNGRITAAAKESAETAENKDLHKLSASLYDQNVAITSMNSSLMCFSEAVYNNRKSDVTINSSQTMVTTNNNGNSNDLAYSGTLTTT